MLAAFTATNDVDANGNPSGGSVSGTGLSISWQNGPLGRDAERQQLQVQLSLTNAKGDIPIALVALYRALGGGWQIRNCNDIVPKRIKKEMADRTGWGTLLKQQNHQPPNSKQQQTKDLYLPNW